MAQAMLCMSMVVLAISPIISLQVTRFLMLLRCLPMVFHILEVIRTIRLAGVVATMKLSVLPVVMIWQVVRVMTPFRAVMVMMH
jgi:hypothetical protein